MVQYHPWLAYEFTEKGEEPAKLTAKKVAREDLQGFARGNCTQYLRAEALATLESWLLDGEIAH